MISSVRIDKGVFSSIIIFKAPGLINSGRIGKIDKMMEGLGDAKGLAEDGMIAAIPKNKAEELVEIIRNGMDRNREVCRHLEQPQQQLSISIADELNEKLNQHNLSFQDIDKLLKLVVNAKKYGFEPKKIVGKLKKIQRLEKKEKRLKNNCVILSNLLDKHKHTVPLAELIEAMGIGKSELISFKIAVNEAIETYGLSPSAAALHVINIISDHNKKAQLKHELSELNLQKYAINEFCSSRSQVINALMNLRSHGLADDKILQLNSFLENNGYKDMISKSLIE